MEKVKLFVSIPFRVEGRSDYFPDSVFNMPSATKSRYVKALIREIGTANAGMEDSPISEIELGNGVVTSLPSGELADIMRAIRKSFHLADDCVIHLESQPGCISTDTCAFLKNYGITYVTLDFLTSNYDEAKTLAMPHTPPVMQATAMVLNFAGFKEFGLVVDAGIPGITVETFRRSLNDAAGFDPRFIEIRNLAVPGFRIICDAVLAEHGFTGRAGDKTGAIYLASGYSLPQAGHDGQIGIGLNALTTFDGKTYKTTGDMEEYLRNSTRYDLIAKPVGDDVCEV